MSGALVDCLPDVHSSNNEFSCYNHLRDLEFPEVDNKEVGLVIGICSPELHGLGDMRRDGEEEPWAGRGRLGLVVFGGVRKATRELLRARNEPQLCKLAFPC